MYVSCISSPSFWAFLKYATKSQSGFFLQMYFCFTNLCKKKENKRKREKKEQETLLELIFDFLFYEEDFPPLLTRDDTSFTWKRMGVLVNPMALLKGKTELWYDTTSCNLMLLRHLSSSRRLKYRGCHPHKRTRDPMEQGWCKNRQLAGVICGATHLGPGSRAAQTYTSFLPSL